MQEVTALSRQVGLALQQKGLQLATAESCTGGGVAQAITAIAGSSGWFLGGVVAYANACKTGLLGVPAVEIDAHGAVSEAVATRMARGALARTQADIAVSTTGIAGPGGAVPGKPVGTVWLACATAEHVTAECRIFQGDREAVRQQSVKHALQMVLQCVEGMPDKP